ncbi:MAG TPA: hypothetical protein VGF50_13590 [Caulobacteraceae bacterium]
MRLALVMLSALALGATPIERAWAREVCAWIAETVADDGDHTFDLTLSADAPASVAVRFQGATFTSASMGGEMIPLAPGQPKVVDGEGFEVDPGDDLAFEVRLYDRPMASLDEMDNPTGKLLAAFTFRRKVGEHESAPPADLAARQCAPLG